jgi:hypothetical protein
MEQRPRDQVLSLSQEETELDYIKHEEQTEFSDDSAPLFAIYQKKAEEEDKNMTDRWQKDADGILIFVSPQSTGFSIAS